MSGWQKARASAAVLGVFLAAAVPFALHREYWPFLYYQMYSTRQSLDRDLVQVQLYGVPRAPGAPEFLIVDGRETAPFDAPRLRMSLQRMVARYRNRPARLRRGLADLADRYEARRLAGLHDGPALAGLKVYRVTWELDPWARNVDAPARMDLLAEIHRAPAGRSSR